MPQVVTDLMAQAAASVSRWAADANGPAQTAGGILIAERADVDVYLTPARQYSPVRSFDVEEIMWKSGYFLRNVCAECTAAHLTRQVSNLWSQRRFFFGIIFPLHIGGAKICR